MEEEKCCSIRERSAYWLAKEPVDDEWDCSCDKESLLRIANAVKTNLTIQNKPPPF